MNNKAAKPTQVRSSCWRNFNLARRASMSADPSSILKQRIHHSLKRAARSMHASCIGTYYTCTCIINAWYMAYSVYETGLLFSIAYKFKNNLLNNIMFHYGYRANIRVFSHRIKSNNWSNFKVQNTTTRGPTLCVKNVPPLVCYNFDIRERILTLFGRNVSHDVSNQKTLYYATSSNVCFCTTWQNGETRKSHFFTQMLYQCIVRIQPVAPWFLQSFWLTTHTHAGVWLPKSCSQCVQLGAAGGRGSGERKSRAPQQLDCIHAQCMCTNALSPWKKKNVICDVFDSVWHVLG